MTSINVAILTEPSVPEGLASQLEAYRNAFDEARTDVERTRREIDEDSDGETSEAIVRNAERLMRTAEDLRNDVDALISALKALGGRLYSVKLRLEAERTRASLAGLTATVNDIHPPSDPDSDAYPFRVEVFNSIDESVYRIRMDEADAHEDFEDACTAIRGIAGKLDDSLGFHGEPRDVPTASDWAERLAIAGTWTLKRLTKSRFAPRFPAGALVDGVNVGGRFRSLSSLGRLEKLVLMTKAENWTAAPGRATALTRTLSKGLSKAGGVLEKVGRGAAVLQGGLAAYEQWKKDSANPSMGTGEKAARAATHGLLEGAAGYGGAWAGAQIGATIGTLGGPVGIAVGGIIGGIVGGMAASEGGRLLADGASKLISKLFH